MAKSIAADTHLAKTKDGSVISRGQLLAKALQNEGIDTIRALCGGHFDFSMGYVKRISAPATLVQIGQSYATVGKNRDIFVVLPATWRLSWRPCVRLLR